MTANYLPAYISPGEFTKFTNHLRIRRPELLTVKTLQEIGVTESNSYTLRGSLIKMGIYDEEGKLLQREDLIGLSAKDEEIRRESYKRIFNRTYADVLTAIPVEEATVDKVRHYFEVQGAAAAPAVKGARLFIWMATQADYKTAEVDYNPYKLDQDRPSTNKSKPNRKNTNANQAAEQTPKQGSIFTQPTTSDYEEVLLNILLEKIRNTNGLPSTEILQQVRELIDSQKEKKNKSHQAIGHDEPSTSTDHTNA